MARCYSGCVRRRYPPCKLPKVWLVSDARIDDRLEDALRHLPRGSGFIFRHYHLPAAERHARLLALARVARSRGHCVVLSGSASEARRWRADGAYGAAPRLASGPATQRLVTVHSLLELGAANRTRADAVLLSPVFATGSHPGARGLGPVRFRLLAAHAQVPVIALGGMDARRARHIGAKHWAAIASLAQPRKRSFPIHS
ncbi:thiamine phosphate synthase [Novosphingobium sp. 9U]|uniref:thiamine phosphate synthase n=1 Tax=Novosphingobium sp. 9U TaxID=2653158 RepID=UPI0012EF8C24|nr:thiamine phosphate synthase [Novosphingobium sp. 9U]VWX53266.1 Thiamine monophosphate synthase [Novosphingobium sp. 9U]